MVEREEAISCLETWEMSASISKPRCAHARRGLIAGLYTFGEKLCPICNCQITEPSFSTHLFEHHPSQVCHKSLTDAIILISSLDMKFILSLGSKL